MTGWVALRAEQFDVARDEHIVAALASDLLQQNLSGNAATRQSWLRTLSVLRPGLAQFPCRNWTVLFEYPLLRVGKRADVVLLTRKGIFVLEFKTGVSGDFRAAARQADDYAQDLHDFHAGCRPWPIIPVAIGPTDPRYIAESILIWHGVVPVQSVAERGLGVLLATIFKAIPEPPQPLDDAWWQSQPYRPIPSIVEAARMAFKRQAVPDIEAARAEPKGLRRTTAAILAEVKKAKQLGERRIVFVTGIPGAGKTRCGLAIAFETEEQDRGVFLTGNPTLVHVFREALARDAAEGGSSLRIARQRVEQRIQALPRFRDHHVLHDHVPDERVIVIDEAQRSWSRDHAVRKTRDRNPALTDSEPAHILDAMSRHDGWAVIVCLVGGGQEIHDGEGGLAEWGTALRDRRSWKAVAAPAALQTMDSRQQLPPDLSIESCTDLHLDVPVRSIRGPEAALWVDAVLEGDGARARAIASESSLPFRLTRDLGAMKSELRRCARGNRRSGLVASSGAQRLRAEGLGAELPHMDANAVSRWFLDWWPDDVRASTALEVAATEFCCQGLELDYVGMAWGGDVIRSAQGRWTVRRFRGKRWETRSGHEAISNGINTYRVLLTRARYETIIWVPRGSSTNDRFHDATRPAAEMDAIADFLLACGARPLDTATEDEEQLPQASLLLA